MCLFGRRKRPWLQALLLLPLLAATCARADRSQTGNDVPTRGESRSRAAAPPPAGIIVEVWQGQAKEALGFRLSFVEQGRHRYFLRLERNGKQTLLSVQDLARNVQIVGGYIVIQRGSASRAEGGKTRYAIKVEILKLPPVNADRALTAARTAASQRRYECLRAMAPTRHIPFASNAHTQLGFAEGHWIITFSPKARCLPIPFIRVRIHGRTGGATSVRTGRYRIP